MDPNATLAEIRRLIDDLDNGRCSPSQARRARADVADLFRALDEWITRGGFLPTAWQRPADRTADRTEAGK